MPGQFRQPSRTSQLPPLISRVLGSFLNSRASEYPRSSQACFCCVKLKAQIGVQTLEGIDRVFGSTEIGLEILDSCCPFLYTNNHQIYHFLVCNRFDPFVLLLEVRHLDLRFGRQPILRNLSRRYSTVEFRLIIDKLSMMHTTCRTLNGKCASVPKLRTWCALHKCPHQSSYRYWNMHSRNPMAHIQY